MSGHKISIWLGLAFIACLLQTPFSIAQCQCNVQPIQNSYCWTYSHHQAQPVTMSIPIGYDFAPRQVASMGYYSAHSSSFPTAASTSFAPQVMPHGWSNNTNSVQCDDICKANCDPKVEDCFAKCCVTIEDFQPMNVSFSSASPGWSNNTKSVQCDDICKANCDPKVEDCFTKCCVTIEGFQPLNVSFSSASPGWSNNTKSVQCDDICKANCDPKVEDCFAKCCVTTEGFRPMNALHLHSPVFANQAQCVQCDDICKANCDSSAEDCFAKCCVVTACIGW